MAEPVEVRSWEAARLIPVSGIGGTDEQERRATSGLLAVVASVNEFARALLAPLGAPAGKVDTFIEVPFKLDGRTVQPDGVIEVVRGSRRWTALVEVKTKDNSLKREQVENYLDVARQEGFDCVLTISNEMATAADIHPTEVDRRKLRKVQLRHLSWTRILSEAMLQKEHRGVSDPEQAWILSELIRYLSHPASGALEFSDMGEHWTTIRDAAAAGTLRRNDEGVKEVVGRWDQLIGFAALRLARQLGADVQPHLTRKELADHAVRADNLVTMLIGEGRLEAGLRIPDAVGPIFVRADLRQKRVQAAVDVQAPSTGRPRTRVNWLVRQLDGCPESIRVDGYSARSRSTTSELLGVLRRDPDLLVDPSKPDLQRFRIVASAAMGFKRGTTRGGFIPSVLDLVDDFYEGTVQNLKPWQAPAPKLQRERPAAEQAARPDPESEPALPVPLLPPAPASTFLPPIDPYPDRF